MLKRSLRILCSCTCLVGCPPDVLRDHHPVVCTRGLVALEGVGRHCYSPPCIEATDAGTLPPHEHVHIPGRVSTNESGTVRCMGRNKYKERPGSNTKDE